MNPIQTGLDLMQIGGWGVVFVSYVVFLWAVFRPKPFLYSRGRVEDVRQEEKARAEVYQEQIADCREELSHERTETAYWRGKYEENLLQDIADMKNRERVIELLAREQPREREAT